MCGGKCVNGRENVLFRDYMAPEKDESQEKAENIYGTICINKPFD